MPHSLRHAQLQKLKLSMYALLATSGNIASNAIDQRIDEVISDILSR